MQNIFLKISRSNSERRIGVAVSEILNHRIIDQILVLWHSVVTIRESPYWRGIMRDSFCFV